MQFLLDANRGIARVVRQDEQDRKLALDRRNHLVAGHHESAVAHHADHLPPGKTQLRRDCSRRAVAHGAGQGRHEPLRRHETKMPVDRSRESACVETDDRVLARLFAHGSHHLHEIDPILGLALRPGGAGLENVLEPPAPGRAGRRNVRLGGRSQRARELDRIAHQTEIGGEMQPDHVIVGAGMHEGLRRPRQIGEAVPLAGDVAKAGAQREYQVALAEGVDLGLRIRQPEFAHIERVPVGEQVVAPERQRDRDMPRLGQGAECLASSGRLESPARDDQGPLRRLNLAQQLAQGLIVRFRARVSVRNPSRLRHLLLLQVLRYHQHHRPRGARGRNADRLEGGFGKLARVGDFEHPFRDRAIHALIVDLLERLAALHPARDLTDKEDHRRRVLARDMHPDARMGRARRARDEGDPRPPGQFAVRLGHVGGAGLVPARDRPDPGGIVERVEDRDEAFTRDAEHRVDAVRGQRVDDGPAAGSCGHRRVVRRKRSASCPRAGKSPACSCFSATGWAASVRWSSRRC